MMPRRQDRLRADLANYGFVPDRARALQERWPPLERVIGEARVGQSSGPSALGRAA